MPISLGPMESEKEKERERDKDKDDEEEEESENGKNKFEAYLKRDLNDYRRRMGNKSNFKGWLAHVSADNVSVDKKLENPEGDYMRLWEESNKRIARTRKRLLKNRRNQTARQKLEIE